MTSQESFKGRVRARMDKTGERYTAARAALLAQAPPRPRHWVSDPEMSDEAVAKGTGRGWDEWVDVITAWPGHTEGHSAIATHLEAEHGLNGWWAQGVTVGYERITGIRLPGQMPDGTFSANKSRTITVDADALRSLLVDSGDRVDLFPGLDTELRSKVGAKTLRIAVGPDGVSGVAHIAAGDQGNGKAKVTVQHTKLPDSESVERWKFFWDDWLTALDAS